MIKIVIDMVINYVEENESIIIKQNIIEELTGYSWDYINKKFIEFTGISIIEYSKSIQTAYIFETCYIYEVTYEKIKGELYWSHWSSYLKRFKEIHNTVPTELSKDYDETKKSLYDYLPHVVDETKMYINNLAEIINNSNIVNSKIIEHLGISKNKFYYYYLYRENIIPHNIVKKIASFMKVRENSLYRYSNVDSVKKLFDSKRLLNNDNLSIIYSIFKENDIIFDEVFSFAFNDDSLTWPKIFTKSIVYDKKIYNYNLSFSIYGTHYMSNQCEYDLVIKYAVDSIYFDLIDSTSHEIFISVISSCLSIAHLLRCSAVRFKWHGEEDIYTFKLKDEIAFNDDYIDTIDKYIL